MKKFEDIKIGDREVLVHVISQDDIEKFVDLTGDNNKLHVDPEFASKTSFKKPVAHGMLGASFISTIIGTRLPGDGALWFSQSLEFLLPVRVGDSLTIVAEVIKITERENIIELKTEISNQNGQKVTTGIAKVKVVPVESITEKVAVQRSARTAIVFGASGGIGREVVKCLAKDGFQIIMHYNTNKAAVESLERLLNDNGAKVSCVSADLRDEEQVVRLVQQSLRWFDKIHVVINCSTIALNPIKFDALKTVDIQGHFAMNVLTNFNIVKAVLPSMKERNSGKFIFLTTQATESTPPTDMLHYVTAKSALNGFVKALAVELSPFNINVNLVSPGMTDTDLLANIPEKVRLLTAAKTPLRRLARTDEIASAIGFLASEQANFITGETLRINGGISML